MTIKLHVKSPKQNKIYFYHSFSSSFFLHQQQIKVSAYQLISFLQGKTNEKHEIKNGGINEMKKRKELAMKQEENMLFYFIY